jgi:SPP1 gp7 family putative phage head morphogenesis protein|nr:MAG TPA: minor capsid protein [Bacteriophage sp.]
MAKIKSSAYWKKRFSNLENANNQYGQNTFHQIEPAFDKAERQIQAQIESWYARYAKNNGITMAEARKQLSATELKELKWDVKEYIQYGQENALNQQWMKELENASARFHISRLEALKIRTQQALEVAFGNELDSLDSMVKALYQSGYYHTCFEVQKGFNIGWEIGQIDERKLQKIISKPWAADGKTFSDRVWQSKTTMVNELHQQLTRTIIQGKAPDEAIRTLSKYVADKTKNAKYAAGRLVMTEQAFISSAAQKDAFNDLDVEEFEIVATLDSHTSEICQNMDGQHFPMKDFEPGVTAPPFHVWCRSTTVPYFDDEWSVGERAARGEDGKTYYVPSDMTYKQWKEKYIADSISDSTKKEFAKYNVILGKKSPTIEEFVKIRYNDEDWKMFKAYTSSIKLGELSALADFALYKSISKDIDYYVVGRFTSNNIKIMGKTYHFIARTIGSVEQKRSGVTITDIVDALLNPVSIDDIRELKNGRSQRFISDKVLVTVNPDTGILIQVNPRTRRKKVNQ